MEVENGKHVIEKDGFNGVPFIYHITRTL